MMTPDAFFTPLAGQSLLIPGQAERFRGQCVQSVGLYVQALGLTFPAHLEAYLYYDNGIPGYEQVGAGNPIKQGDLIVWGKNFPASPGAGHIDVASQDGTLANFVAWDSNWYPPLKLAKLSHLGNNNNYIVGYLRRTEDEVTWNKGDTYNLLYRSINLGAAEEAKNANYVGFFGAQNGEEYKAALETIINSVQYGLMVQGAQAPTDYVPYSGPALYNKKS